jgi:hypothetical protein
MTTYTVTLRRKANDDIDDVRNLRWILKTLLRRYDLQCIKIERLASNCGEIPK